MPPRLRSAAEAGGPIETRVLFAARVGSVGLASRLQNVTAHHSVLSMKTLTATLVCSILMMEAPGFLCKFAFASPSSLHNCYSMAVHEDM